jgi:hypothetical protein
MNKCHNCGEFVTTGEKYIFCSSFCCGSHWEKRQGVGKLSGKEFFTKLQLNELSKFHTSPDTGE